jgi:hypothetical protein
LVKGILSDESNGVDEVDGVFPGLGFLEDSPKENVGVASLFCVELMLFFLLVLKTNFLGSFGFDCWILLTKDD